MKKLLLMCLISVSAMGQNCNLIKKEVDKFNGEIRYRSPYGWPVEFTKIIKGADTTFYLVLTAYSGSIFSGDGVVVLLENGQRIERPKQRVTSDYSTIEHKYEYTAYVTLGNDDVGLLSKNNITDFQVYIFEGNMNARAKKKTPEFFYCITHLKE